MEILDKFSRAIETYVHPNTRPIAIKMLRGGEKIPENMKRPKRDLGARLIPCQATFLSRKSGIPLAMLKEDFNTDFCSTGSIVFGIVPAVDEWKRGDISYGIFAKTRKAAATMERNVFRFERGRYAGFLAAPLDKVDFEPDMIMVYCNSEQAMSLILASRYDDGLPIRTTVSARNVCSDAIVQTIKTGKCRVCIPCGGDRVNAYAGADEIVFTAPMKKLGTIVEGLEAAARARAPPVMKVLGVRKSVLDRKYRELARTIKKRT